MQAFHTVDPRLAAGGLFLMEIYNKYDFAICNICLLYTSPNSNQVTITLSNNAADQNSMLGYEIYRNGRVIGFVEAKDGTVTFTDTIASMNNRVFTYEAVGYDKLLQQTERAAIDLSLIHI